MSAHRSSPRLHRFPHRIDYTLIPAPLDLSLPLKTEKDSLPAIIVTPSSPSSARDFSIAFLSTASETFYPRTHQLVCAIRLSLPAQGSHHDHSIPHLLRPHMSCCHPPSAARRPHLEFSVQTGDAHLVDSSFGTWFIRSIWGEDGTFDAKREFIVDDAPSLIRTCRRLIGFSTRSSKVS
ncbi:hypothetical protein B0H13DRAFT_2649260 [Mycena leptocephala]|nr:hypothetical protein B0H13DRAFT_2649260 [Mycena leptocephala]